MARRRKIHVHDYGPTRYGSHATSFTVHVAVSRGTRMRSHAYHACAMISKRGGRQRVQRTTECAYGAAPRRAGANALKRLASVMVRRSSAFRGT
jgi:hypothetical protein